MEFARADDESARADDKLIDNVAWLYKANEVPGRSRARGVCN
jgi:hypothetical protein